MDHAAYYDRYIAGPDIEPEHDECTGEPDCPGCAKRDPEAPGICTPDEADTGDWLSEPDPLDLNL